MNRPDLSTLAYNIMYHAFCEQDQIWMEPADGHRGDLETFISDNGFLDSPEDAIAAAEELVVAGLCRWEGTNRRPRAKARLFITEAGREFWRTEWPIEGDDEEWR